MTACGASIRHITATYLRQDPYCKKFIPETPRTMRLRMFALLVFYLPFLVQKLPVSRPIVSSSGRERAPHAKAQEGVGG